MLAFFLNISILLSNLACMYMKAYNLMVTLLAGKHSHLILEPLDPKVWMLSYSRRMVSVKYRTEERNGCLGTCQPSDSAVAP